MVGGGCRVFGCIRIGGLWGVGGGGGFLGKVRGFEFIIMFIGGWCVGIWCWIGGRVWICGGCGSIWGCGWGVFVFEWLVDLGVEFLLGWLVVFFVFLLVRVVWCFLIVFCIFFEV